MYMLISPYFVHIDDYIIALLNAIHSKSENEYPLSQCTLML